MSIMFIVLGAIFVVSGILSITKKWMWIQQGFAKRPVHVEKYMRYMGRVDIIFGLFGIALGIFLYGKNINDSISFAYIMIYFPPKIWGELKYRTKQ